MKTINELRPQIEELRKAEVVKILAENPQIAEALRMEGIDPEHPPILSIQIAVDNEYTES